MTENPVLFRGLTVEEHLDYIKGLYSTFEQQFVMVKRLLDTVDTDREPILATIKASLTSELERSKTKPATFFESQTKEYQFSTASLRLEELLKDLQRHCSRNQVDLSSIDGFDWCRTFLHGRECMEEDEESPLDLGPNPSIADRLFNLPTVSPKHYAEFAADLEQATEFLVALKSAHPSLPLIDLLDTHLMEIKSVYSEPPAPANFLYMAFQEFIGVLLPEERIGERKTWIATINTQFKEHQALIDFSEELTTETKDLKSLASIYVDNVLDSMKINWIGTQVDCKILFSFLQKNQYMDIAHLNQFLAAHFTFKNETASAEQLGKLHTERGGKFIHVSGVLKIPER